MTPIAHIETPYGSKFGVPRQSGLASTEGRVVFEPQYRVAESIRGLEEFDYIWLLWLFHLTDQEEWSPTVRPPRLGGNRRMGVFATRSPFRPNHIGLSCSRLLRVETTTNEGPVLHVEGIDLVDGTPILDIKPYLPYTDAHADARAGFATVPPKNALQVIDPTGALSVMPQKLRLSLIQSLAQDPRPHYHHDEREYTMPFGGYEITFRVNEEKTLEVITLN